ncbi:MAG: tRNA lysidine(34) synthetase TilS [Alphaproteobacteria bacterium]
MSSGVSAVHEATTAAHPLNNHYAVVMAAEGYFEPHPVLAIGVSGGPDSMALLLLSHRWVRSRGGKVIALTVDHGLRPEAAQEASWVKQQCRALGIRQHILRYDGPPITAGIQETARTIRYKLLADWCHTHGVLHLLTAHHAGDQAETLLFRLARGSGLTGLAGIATDSVRLGVRLIRPLLNVQKTELVNYLQAEQHQWVEDPSNSNPAYSRTQFRIHLGAHIITRATEITKSVHRFRSRLELKEASCLTECVSIYPAGYATLNYETFMAVPPVLAGKILGRVLHTVSGSHTPPRSQTVAQLYTDLKTTPLRRTVHGCMLQWKNKHGLYYISRELAATSPPYVLQPGKSTRWDNRFDVWFEPGGTLKQNVTIGPLGTSGLAQLPDMPSYARNLPPAVRQAFIALFYLEEVLCVPHMSLMHKDYGFLRCNVQFHPTKPLADAPFFGMNNVV